MPGMLSTIVWPRAAAVTAAVSCSPLLTLYWRRSAWICCGPGPADGRRSLPVGQDVHRSAQRQVEYLGEAGADRGQDGLHTQDRADALLDKVAAVFGQHTQPRLGGVAPGDRGQAVAGA